MPWLPVQNGLVVEKPKPQGFFRLGSMFGAVGNTTPSEVRIVGT